ncbi:MAG: hypothetical protein K8T89_15995 [Planctomycetes bacterium]|nr:hypothetical protein [Planctomycetota bacterium]
MVLRPQRWLLLLVCGLAVLAAPASIYAQAKTTGYNEREIEPQLHAFDKPDNWTLHFRFKDPQVISCDVPGFDKKKVVWYMIYQVVNHTGEPRFFVPDIDLKTHDFETLHPDEVMPAVQKIISEIEDPTGKLNIKNSVTISKEPIPISKKDAFPRTVTGVAIWTDVYERAAKTNRFSIFVAGLSDGWRKDQNDVIRRKTLQINFNRLGDEIQPNANAIRWVDNPSWIYRATDIDLTGKGKKENVILEPIKEEAFLPKLPLNRPVLLPTPREVLLPPPPLPKKFEPLP